MDQANLLDTNILIFWTAGGRAAAYLDESFHIESSGFRPLISTVSIGEASAVMECDGFGEKRKNVLKMIVKNVTPIDVHLEEVVTAFTTLFLHLKRFPKGDRRRGIGDNDIWIAASALAADARLITSDGKLKEAVGSVVPTEHVDHAYMNKLIKG